MTDEQIIKALECCVRSTSRNDCEDLCCPACKEFGCHYMDISDRDDSYEALIEGLGKAVLDLINRQKAEIERLKTEKDNLIKTYKGCMTEAIKEFDKKFKEKSSSAVTSCQGKEIYETKQYQISAVNFDDLVKEMVGESSEDSN